MSSQDLSQRCDKAESVLDDLSTKVQQSAENAQQEVTTRLEEALTALLEVVAKVHSSYQEDGKLDEERKSILQDMKSSFTAVENAAASRTKNLGTLHEKITTLQNQQISPLLQEVQSLCDQSQKEIGDADDDKQRLEQDIRDADNELQRGQEKVNSFESLIIDNPVADVAIGFWDIVTNGATKAIGASREDLKRARENLEAIRSNKYTLERKMEEAFIERQKAVKRADDAKSLVEQIKPLIPRAERLAERINTSKEALIHIKAKATSLNAEASDVAASASVTSSKSYSKSEFASGILNICQEAIFDITVKDKVELILAKLLQVWKIDGNNAMPIKLKTRFEQVQTVVKEAKQDNA